MTEKRKYTCKQMKILGIAAIVSQLLVNMLILRVSTENLIIYTIVVATIVFITMYFDCKKEKEERD